MAEKKLSVVIVGGSLGGLMHGIVLKRLGHNVHILNRNPSAVLHDQGAGLTALQDVQDFIQQFDLLEQPYSIPSPHVQFLNKDAEVVRKWDIATQMTSWNVLYNRLRANFDGLQTDFCPDPPTEVIKGEGKAVYDYGKTVTNVQYNDGHVTVEFTDANGGSGTLHTDLVIGADGPNSTIRQLMQPELQRKYAGYVAWRGAVLEQDVSEEARKVLGEKLTFFQKGYGHVLLYTIPGSKGSLEPGYRLLNYVWYCNLPAASPEFKNVMTDKSGQLHHSTLPIGAMRDEIWAEQKAYATKVLPAVFAELVHKTKQPFIQVITDISSPRASFFDGKLLLVGDALATFRPHAGASTNQAAKNALSLEKVMKAEMTLEQWETKALQYARLTGLMSIAWGTKNQFGLGAFLVSALWYGKELASQKVWNWWYG